MIPGREAAVGFHKPSRRVVEEQHFRSACVEKRDRIALSQPWSVRGNHLHGGGHIPPGTERSGIGEREDDRFPRRDLGACRNGGRVQVVGIPCVIIPFVIPQGNRRAPEIGELPVIIGGSRGRRGLEGMHLRDKQLRVKNRPRDHRGKADGNERAQLHGWVSPAG